jgi:hypothetical protein
MWTCPNCKIEMEPGFDVCWACGATRDGEQTGFDPEKEGILATKDYEADVEAKRHEDLVPLASYNSVVEAHMVRARLEAEEVTAVVMDEETGTAWSIMVHTGIRIGVPEHQLGQAQEVLDKLAKEKRPHDVASPDEQSSAATNPEGIRTELPPELTQKDRDVFDGLSPEHLLYDAFRASIIGFIVPCFPFHVISFYLVLRFVSMPGQPSPKLRRRFILTLVISAAVTLLWWLPLTFVLLLPLARWVNHVLSPNW